MGIPGPSVGPVPHARIHAFLEQATALIYPSENEGFPSAIMESMCFGVPVVSSPVGGIPDLLGAGRGLLADPGDGPGFARAVGSLLSDETRRRDLAERARAFAHAEFHPDRILAQIEAVYREALSDP